MKHQTSNPELYELSRPIPKKLIEPPPQGRHGHYVPHFVINQILLATVGPFDWELQHILMGDMQEVKKRDGTTIGEAGHGVVGAVYRLTAIVDGMQVSIEEVGSVHLPAKEPTDADRLKKASSDCMKRCAMRLGVGIHLWCKRPEQFSLPRVLTRDEGEGTVEELEAVIGGEEDDE